MKKVNKIVIIAILAIIGLIAISCDDDYDQCINGHFFPHWTESVCSATANSERTCLYCPQIDTRLTGLGHDHTGSFRCKRDGCFHAYNVRDTGPAGGTIIYASPTGFIMTDDNSTYYYLEAAPETTRLRWSTLTEAEFQSAGSNNSLFINIPGTQNAIGTGRRNTSLILSLDATAPAALACRNYISTGYENFTDWFLPSREELNLIFSWAIDNPNDVRDNRYWSSSQDNQTNAWIRIFGSSLTSGRKFQYNYVRAIRAF
jgi:hypothetical protein